MSFFIFKPFPKIILFYTQGGKKTPTFYSEAWTEIS